MIVVGNGVSGFACAARLASEGVPVDMIGPGRPACVLLLDAAPRLLEARELIANAA